MRVTLGIRFRWLLTIIGLAASLIVAPSGAAQQVGPIPEPTAELTPLGEGAYAWRYGNYHTIFIVTDEGVIAADPSALANPRAADLFKAVISTVTDQPVRYLVMSHGNPDHAAGGDVFTDTATLIGTRLAADKLADLNSARHPVPTVIVDEYMRLELGGRVVDLYRAGPISGGDHLFLHYPAGRALFATDWAEPRRLPFRTLVGTASIDAWVTALEWIETGFDFDVLVPGHSRLGTKATVRENQEYFRDLESAIRAARAQGHPDNSDAMVASVRTALSPRYGTWQNFDTQLGENIQGVIRIWSEQ
jgi:glyoxylase-like metal-dependent hydrolase (beta-lactamase superfamily II)